MMPAVMAIFGFKQDTETAAFTASNTACKNNFKAINSSLGDNQYLCGNTITIADYIVANGHVLAFQTMLDAGSAKLWVKPLPGSKESLLNLPSLRLWVLSSALPRP